MPDGCKSLKTWSVWGCLLGEKGIGQPRNQYMEEEAQVDTHMGQLDRTEEELPLGGGGAVIRFCSLGGQRPHPDRLVVLQHMPCTQSATRVHRITEPRNC